MVRNVDVGRRSSFEHNKAPGDVIVTEQSLEIAPKVLRRPLCQRPLGRNTRRVMWVTSKKFNLRGGSSCTFNI